MKSNKIYIDKTFNDSPETIHYHLRYNSDGSLSLLKKKNKGEKKKDDKSK